jgi:hypothetical protein
MMRRILLKKLFIQATIGSSAAFTFTSRARGLLRPASLTLLSESLSTANPSYKLSPQELQQTVPNFLGMCNAFFSSQALYTVTRLGVADLIGSGSLSVAEIVAGVKEHDRNSGKQCYQNLNEDSLFRVMRLLSGTGIFTQTAGPNGEARYSLTPMGALLQTNVPEQPSLACGVLHWTEAPMWNSWGRLHDFVAGTTENGATAFEAANGLPIFQYYQEHPESNDPFNEFMTVLSASNNPVVLDLVPWSKYNGKNVADVGGGYGTVSSLIQNKFPDVQMISFDMPHIVEQARTSVKAPDAVKLVGGDMFDASTYPKDLSAIFMKYILHDWDDDSCIRILQACAKALPSDGKVFIVDAILPNPGEDSPVAPVQYHLDVLMMLFGGKERTSQQMSILADAAGFKVESTSTNSPVPTCMLTTLVKK